MNLFLALILSAAAWAQPLSVYSEFARINAAGDVTAPETPREILSPALVRNGFTSFQVVVQAAADADWWLFVGQNPENATRMTIYREMGDALDPVELPYRGTGTEIFWLDLFIPPNARAERLKVEPELRLNESWVTYPIEGRVTEARVPGQLTEPKAEPKYVCPLALSNASTPVARLQLRNAAQDGALEAQAPAEELTKLLGFCDVPSPSTARRFGTESYLRIRDYLFRLR